MLKALKVTSLIIMIFAYFLTAGLIVLSVKDTPKTSVPPPTPKISSNTRLPEYPKDATPELVVQARAFALRIDPPIPQETKISTRATGGKTEYSGEDSESETTITIVDPPPPPPRFDLLATVRYVSAPEKSLALFQTGGRQEWFYKGQTVGQHTIENIKDGRVTLLQPDRQSQELSVPPKNNKTLLKSD